MLVTPHGSLFRLTGLRRSSAALTAHSITPGPLPAVVLSAYKSNRRRIKMIIHLGASTSSRTPMDKIGSLGSPDTG